jgi:hypothetical protein
MEKNKIYEGKEITLDEEDEHVVALSIWSNGITIMIDQEYWKDIKKELKEALE